MSPHHPPHTQLKKSVAWVTPFLGRGGKLMYMEPLLTGLAQHCKEFTAITAEYTGNTKNSPFNIIIGGRLRRLYWKGKDHHLKGFTFIGPGFLKSITSSKAEILFLVEFSLTTIYGILTKIIKRKTKIVLVMESAPVKNEGSILGLLKSSLRKAIVKRCDAILTNNQSGKDFLVNQLGANPSKIIAKPYLISHVNNSSIPDSERYRTLDNTSKIHFLYVGRLMKAKGLQHLVDAVGLVPEKYRSRIHVDIVGGGDYREELSAYIAHNNLENNFQFHGAVEYSALSDFYSTAHVFVFPTLRDYRALVPFEALNAGLPIISSIYDGGVYENVIEGKNGHICDPLNITLFSEILMDVLSNPEKLYPYSLKSTEMAKDYTLDNAINNLLSAAHLAISQP